MKKKMKNDLLAIITTGIFLIGTLLSSCNASNTAKGGAIGAAAGGAAGAAIGSKSDNTAVGAILGAAIGGTAGALIGRHMDKQAEELQADLEGAEVERVGEGIKITFDSGLLFDVDSYNLKSSTKDNLSDLSQTLKKYNETNILIEGHTDATGSGTYNQQLSEKRAQSVSEFLITKDVDMDRLMTVGYGEEQPIASNGSSDGRRQNRRVEVAIFANDKMKEMAEEGKL